MTITDAPAATGRHVSTLTVNQFRNILTAHTLTMCQDPIFPVLSAIRFQVSEETLNVTSTDRYRLTRSTTDVGATGEEVDFLLSGGRAKAFLAALPKTNQARKLNVGITFGDGTMTVELPEGDVVSANNVDGEFPNIEYLLTPVEAPQPVTRIGIDPKLMAPLAKMPMEKNTYLGFHVNGEHKPMWTKWEHDGTRYVHVMMPVRLTDDQ
jgi:hypothetical protein